MRLSPALTPAAAWAMPYDAFRRLVAAAEPEEDEDDREPPGIAMMRRMMLKVPGADRRAAGR